jgi:large subunit ribosomal protein L2
MTSQDFEEITTKKPIKSLLVIKKRVSGRNNQGRITTRHKGGGAKKYYRLVDFNLKPGTEAIIEAIEYDPNRTARIARIKDLEGNYHYIIAASNMRVGKTIKAGEEVGLKIGNRLPLKEIPTGTAVYAVELQPGKGAQLARSAGNSAQLVAKEAKYAQIKLPSGEVRMVSQECMAFIGVVSNQQHQNIKIGKAGRNRKRGIRPTVRGVVMNAADHPHGGGDGGKSRIGKDPRTPWGKKTLGFKTRKRKLTNKFIVKNRHQAKRR